MKITVCIHLTLRRLSARAEQSCGLAIWANVSPVRRRWQHRVLRDEIFNCCAGSCARGCGPSRSRRYSSCCAWRASEVGGLGFVLAWGDLFRLEKPRKRANGDENAAADRDVLELPNLYEVADLPLGDPDAPSELLRRFHPLIIVRHRLAPSIT
jgi:hypothetical protein